MITKEVPSWIEEAKDLSNNRVKWDWLKFKIKTNSISLSKKISRDRQDLENKLNTKYQNALKNFQENPSNVTKLEIEKLKSKMERLYKERRGNNCSFESTLAGAWGKEQKRTASIS